MTTTALERRVTAQGFLFNDASGRDSAELLGRAVQQHGLADASLRGVRQLARSALDGVEHEIGRVGHGLLDLDLGDVLLGGWRQYSQLTESARRTRGAPGSEEVVVLATHRITCSHRPQVDLFVDGVRVHRFDFDLAMAFDVDGLSAVVRSGALVAVHGGECHASGTLRVDGATLAERRGRFDPGLVVTLRHPVPLVPVRQAPVGF